MYWVEAYILQYKEKYRRLVVGSKETVLEVNSNKTKYMVKSRDQNAGRIHNIKIDSSSLE